VNVDSIVVSFDLSIDLTTKIMRWLALPLGMKRATALIISKPHCWWPF